MTPAKDEDFVKVGQYRGLDVFLHSFGGSWYLSFDKPTNQKFWLEAINRILQNNPDYVFSTNEGIEIDVKEMKSILNLVNNLILYVK